jgi:hypothetical protein
MTDNVDQRNNDTTMTASRPKQGSLFDDEPLGIEDFGRRLIQTRDLDPMYCGVVDAKLPPDQLARWLLSYLCYYHVGSASWMSQKEGDAFWSVMRTAAANKESPRVHGLPCDRWPRGSERRHLRGSKAIAAIEWLATTYPRPEEAIEYLAKSNTAQLVMNLIRQWPMFGGWVAFKAADVIANVWGKPLQFPDDICLMYAEPLAGLEMAARRAGIVDLKSNHSEPLRNYHTQLLDYFCQFPAPPTYARRCGPTELETVACKVKSYWGGHYYLGRDIREHRAALFGWGETAHQILNAYPPPVF